MKHLFLLTVFSFLALSASAQSKAAVELTFKTEHIELGQVKKGEKRTFDYTFTNTGTDNIEIEIVSGCDCTTLDWTKGEIKPGETGVIDVIFDSTEKEASETVDLDIYLKNINPISDSQYLIVLDYKFELLK